MLRERLAAFHDPGGCSHTSARMSYDLRRIRLKGLIRRITGKSRYVLTVMGRRAALFFTKVYARILRPGLARIDPALPPDRTDALRSAWRSLDNAVDHHVI